LALRRHTLPRYWLGLTLGGVALLCGVAYWWEQQLPLRLRDAAQRGDLEACLRYSEQLAALRWLGQKAPSEQATCRRRQAELAWEQGDRSQALRLQEQLVNSAIGSISPPLVASRVRVGCQPLPPSGAAALPILPAAPQ